MEGLVTISPTDLYNILQQTTSGSSTASFDNAPITNTNSQSQPVKISEIDVPRKFVPKAFSKLSDPNYLLLVDARSKNDYNESHIVTARKAPKDSDGYYFVPYDWELECKQNIVVYDSNSTSTKELTDAVNCGSLLWEKGSRGKVYILNGGYEEFSALYPFLRTQKIMWMPRELDEIKAYPTEIIPGLLYLGDWRQGNAAYIQKDLKIKAHINCCVESSKCFQESSNQLLHIQVDDSNDAEIGSKFETACKFISKCQEKKQPVLVYSNLGISRSAAIVIAYVIWSKQTSYKEAFEHVHRCSCNIQPNQAFMKQLEDWHSKQSKAK